MVEFAGAGVAQARSGVRDPASPWREDLPRGRGGASRHGGGASDQVLGEPEGGGFQRRASEGSGAEPGPRTWHAPVNPTELLPPR